MNLFGFINKPKTQHYDLSTIEGIMSIQIPRYPKINGVASPVENIEYILQRKATEYKKSGQMDLAIACLRKSNELMPYSNFSYQAKDYLRLVKYIRLTGDNETADIEEEKIRQNHPELFDARIRTKNRAMEIISKAQKYECDLIYVTSKSTCPICAQYNHKTYSISGKSKIYPSFPKELLDGGSCEECCIGFTLSIK